MQNSTNYSRTLALEKMVQVIDEQMRVAQVLSCGEAVSLLRMTKLSLQMDMHAISEEELRALCTALEDGAPSEQNQGTQGMANVLVQEQEPAAAKPRTEAPIQTKRWS